MRAYTDAYSSLTADIPWTPFDIRDQRTDRSPVVETGTVPASAPYAVLLDYAILEQETITVTDTTTSTPLAIVLYPASPGAGQASVKYDTGYVQVHSSRAGNDLSVAYTPSGTALTSDLLNRLQVQIDAALDASHMDIKASVKCATTANITLSGEQTLDGILTSASRVLVKNQSAPAQNGIYVSATGAWARAEDFDAWTEIPNAFTWVEQGTTLGDTGWVCTSNTGGTLGVTAITWAQFAGVGTFTADGQGIELTGTVFGLELDGSTLSKSASGVKVADGGISNTQVNAAAAIAHSKMAALTASRAMVTDGSGVASVSAATATEVGYLSGVTSAIQTQINNISQWDFQYTLTVSPSGDADYTTIQAAIDAVPDIDVTNKWAILVFPGVYTEQANLDHPNITIFAMGDRDTVIITTSSTTEIAIDVSATNCSLVNLTLRNTINAYASCALRANTGSSGLHVRGCYIYGEDADCVIIQPSLTGVVFERCWFESDYDHVSTYSSVDLIDCTWKGGGGAVVWVDGAVAVNVINGHWITDATDGSYFLNLTGGCTINLNGLACTNSNFDSGIGETYPWNTLYYNQSGANVINYADIDCSIKGEIVLGSVTTNPIPRPGGRIVGDLIIETEQRGDDTANDSRALILRTIYDDITGDTNQDQFAKDASIVHNVTAYSGSEPATVTSQIDLKIAGSTKASVKDTGEFEATSFNGNLNASQLASGTIPDARFPATLPAGSGANLTNLDASDLASGTIPDARFPATLPAVSGANLTNLDASDLASGTVPVARMPSGWVKRIYSNTAASSTVSNTAAETNFDLNVSIPSADFAVNRTIKWWALVSYDTDNAGATFQLNAKLGSVTLVASPSGRIGSADGTAYVAIFEGEATVRTVGGSASIYGSAKINGFDTGPTIESCLPTANAATVDTTTAQTFQISVQWSGAHSDNAAILQQLNVYMSF